MGRIISILSGKGGVGKTTLAINLSAALHALNNSTMLVDCNFFTPNVSIYLGTENVTYSLHEVLNRNENITKAIYQHPSGLKIIPGSLAIKYASNEYYLKLSELRNHFDYLSEITILDGPPGLNNEVKEVLRNSNETIIITNPELPALVDALKLMKIAKQQRTTILGVVLNRVTRKNHELTKKQVEEFLNTVVIAELPEDIYVKHSLKIKHPVIYSHPHARISNEIFRLARLIH
ncbi:MAG: P-loop NTPase [Candidatus Woesearchaeota archaeon]